MSVLSSVTLADTIRFKDGSIIKGNILSYRSGTFVVEVGEGPRKRQFTYAASEVESITFDARSAPPATPVSVSPAYSRPEPKVVQPAPAVVIAPTPRTTSSQPKTNSTGGGTTSLPAHWTKKIPADNSNNGWTNSGWVAKKGQRIRITGDGNISLGKGQTSTPSGVAELSDEQKLMKSVPTGALIAVIGDDNNDFIYIGAEREFTATRDGPLFLGVNEANLVDNSGAFDVTIEIIPDSKR